MESTRNYTPLLACLLVACIARLWLSLLPESYWLDETVTAFMVRYGIHHPSLAFAPKLDLSLYYWLPRASQALFGSSEASLRLPSLLATCISLILTARLAARLIHPQAAWFAVFLCFLPHEFTRQATDARPYGLGTCVALAAIWFLIRWLDHARWIDAALFCLSAALLLRVHLIYWPFYAVFVIYALFTPVPRRALAIVFGIVAASLIPLIPATLALSKQAGMHVVVDKSQATSFLTAFQLPMILGCALSGWLLGRIFHWPRQRIATTFSGCILIAAWWLWQPACLLAFSAITGNSVFVARYFSLAIPGMVLAAALALSAFIPAANWKPLTIILATGILIAGFAHGLAPPSRNSDWRDAARTVNNLIRGTSTPVLCPSPFIEAQPPVWTPNYTLPGFFYAHLAAYPIEGDTILLPARLSPEGERYVQPLIEERIVPAGRFVLYSGVYGVYQWLSWLENQPKLNPWKKRHISFGDVELVVFER
jgi:mannosyltransferase